MFDAEHGLPGPTGELRPYQDREDDALDLTLELSRMLRPEKRPSPGVHVKVRAGQLQLLASPDSLAPYVLFAARISEDVVLARFAPPKRGRESSFLPGLRTFGDGDADPVSELERLHAEQVCRGCAIDRADEDYDPERLQGLGVYVYVCDEEHQIAMRGLVPPTPLSVASIGALAGRCFRYHGDFAHSEQIPVRELERPKYG